MAEGSRAASTSRDKPLLKLIKRLTKQEDNKASTLLKNTQIIDILNKEFDLNITNMHELAIDIYINLIKRFLKDWPHWDEFDVVINDLKTSGNGNFDTILEMEYKKLKGYLKAMLTASHSMVKEAVDSVTSRPQSRNTKTQAEDNTNDVIMELQCTRDQLNTLFFRCPVPESNFTIFNVSDAAPSKITLNTLSLKSIISWFNVNFQINSNVISYTRTNTHKLQQILVNKKVDGNAKPPVPLDDSLQEKKTQSHSNLHNKYLTNVIERFKTEVRLISVYSGEILELVNLVFGLMQSDIQQLKVVTMRAKYRRFLNKFAYVRYLYKDVDTSLHEADTNKYDIQLEEMVSPSYEFSVRKNSLTEPLKVSHDWLRIQCVQCNLPFGSENIASLKNHFMEVHKNEPDWQCSNCNKVFSMACLTENGWCHKC